MGLTGFLDRFHISYQVCLAELLSGKDGSAGVEEWTILFWSGPSYFGSGGHFWTGWEEWMALRFKWMVPKSGVFAF